MTKGRALNYLLRNLLPSLNTSEFAIPDSSTVGSLLKLRTARTFGIDVGKRVAAETHGRYDDNNNRCAVNSNAIDANSSTHGNSEILNISFASDEVDLKDLKIESKFPGTGCLSHTKFDNDLENSQSIFCETRFEASRYANTHLSKGI